VTLLLLAPAFGGAALGLGLLGLGDGLGPFLDKNQLAPSARALLVWTALGGAGVGALLAVWAVLFRSAEWGIRLGKTLCPLAGLAVLPLLLSERLFRKRDLLFLLAVWVTSALAAISFSAASEARALPLGVRALRFLRSPRLQPLGFFLAVIGAVSYAIYFSKITLASHYNFCTSAFDLGIEDNLLWGATHGTALFRSAPLGGSMLHGGNHQTYFAYALVPIYVLFPRAETLLIVQSVFLGAAAIPLYLYAAEFLGAALAVLVSLGYLLYAPLHGANLYDFHYQPFGIFFTFTIAYLLLKGASKLWLGLAVFLMLSVREDMGAMLAALGGFFVLSGRRSRSAFVLMLLGASYFVAFKLWIMPQYFMGGESSFAYMYKDLLPSRERGFGGVLKTVLTNPLFVMESLLTREKLLYVLQIFVPVSFLSLKRSQALLLFAPACTFTLLSTGYPALIMTSFQYTSYWTPMVFLALIEVLKAPSIGRFFTPNAVQVGRAVAIAIALLLTSNRYGAIFQTETLRGAFDPVRVEVTSEDRKNHQDFMELAKQVPPSAKLVASEWLVSHVSNRRDAYTLRFGILDAEYLLFWTHPEKLRSDEKPLLKRALLGKDATFGVIEKRGIFVLAKRGHDVEKNASLRSAL